jgi:hypothetical protein
MRKHFDPASLAVILLTLGLFVAALFAKGLTHDLLLEAGVFLVSVKLVMMAYKDGIMATKLAARLDDIQSTLARVERRIDGRDDH